MKKIRVLAVLALAVALGAALYAASYRTRAVHSKVKSIPLIRFEPVFKNLKFERPVDLQQPYAGHPFLYLVEQPGVLKRFKNDPQADSSEVVLDLRSKIFFDQGETGLLGLAFDPEFKQNGFFYVNYTAPEPLRTVIARYRIDSDGKVAQEESLLLLEINQPYANHNGGQISFGPDGFLYIGMGDGGAAGDPHGNAQNLHSLLGKFLRIDTHGATPQQPYAIPSDNPFAQEPGKGRPEIYAWGLRNPWRFSWDGKNRLWTGDVGQNLYEEIHLIEKGKNYGWNILEGSHCFPPEKSCSSQGLELPVFEYPHKIGSCVIGGFAYQGSQIPELRGRYLFSDFVSRRVFLMTESESGNWKTDLLFETPGQITSFATDAEKEIYALDILGRIFKITKPAQN